MNTLARFLRRFGFRRAADRLAFAAWLADRNRNGGPRTYR